MGFLTRGFWASPYTRFQMSTSRYSEAEVTLLFNNQHNSVLQWQWAQKLNERYTHSAWWAAVEETSACLFVGGPCCPHEQYTSLPEERTNLLQLIILTLIRSANCVCFNTWNCLWDALRIFQGSLNTASNDISSSNGKDSSRQMMDPGENDTTDKWKYK